MTSVELDAPPEEAPPRPSTRIALWVFVAGMVVAYPMYMVFGRHNWFFLDEWDFLANRSLTSIDDLLRPHNEHWSTLPIIAYRVQWKLFGLKSYMPYLAMVVALHIAAAALLRVVMRRAGVAPWLATSAAGLFLFLGSGAQDIIWAFQIGFVGSLVAGLLQLVLTDHDGPFDRRDWFGLAAGLVALLCSGVGVTMVVIVGLAVLVRRGWRMAAAEVLPLGAVFAVWWLAYGRDGVDSTRPGPGDMVRFVVTAFSHAMHSIGQVTILAVVLVAAFVIGAVVHVVDDRARLRATFAPWALCAGALVFTVIAATGRAGTLGVDFARAGRYVHLIAAMTIPAMAVAVQALATRWRWMLPVGCLLFVAAIPGNIVATRVDTFNEAVLRGHPDLVKTLPVSDLAHKVPAGTEPGPVDFAGVRIGWLLRAHRSGRLPDPPRRNPRLTGMADARLALWDQTGRGSSSSCHALTKPVVVRVGKGDVIRFKGGSLGVTVLQPTVWKKPQLLFIPGGEDRIRVQADGLTLRLSSRKGFPPAHLCR